MSYITINTLEIPKGAEAVLEGRFRERKHEVDNEPGFLGFQLLRPVEGTERYFVITTWETKAHFDAWMVKRAERKAHAPEGKPAPVTTDHKMMEFEVVAL